MFYIVVQYELLQAGVEPGLMNASRVIEGKSGLEALLASPALTTITLYFLLFQGAVHFRRLQRETGLGTRSLRIALARLHAAGIVSREEAGNRVLYRARTGEPAWWDLRRLARDLAPAADVLRVALRGVEGLDGAFLFGSVARGADEAHSDLDVLVWGRRVDPVELSRRMLEVGALLDREANALLYVPEELERKVARGGFLDRVWSGEKIWLLGSADAVVGVS